MKYLVEFFYLVHIILFIQIDNVHSFRRRRPNNFHRESYPFIVQYPTDPQTNNYNRASNPFFGQNPTNTQMNNYNRASYPFFGQNPANTQTNNYNRASSPFFGQNPTDTQTDDYNRPSNTIIVQNPPATYTIDTADLFDFNTNPSINTRNNGEEDDPCDKYNPVKPDFRKNGRRISEIKCYEFIWQMKVRHDEYERVKKCQAKLKLLQSFVVGGHSTNLGEYPHMAAIGWQGVDEPWIFKCGGSLISETFVLTAAHCTNSPPDTRLIDTEPRIARLGNKNLLNVNPQDIPIKRIIKHPRYAPPKKYFDIALFELESPTRFSKTIQPACLWRLDDVSSLGPKVTVAGWGVKQERSNEGSTELQAATVDLINSNSCDNYLRSFHNRHWAGLANHQICAGKLVGGIDVCQGDSGGPLQVQIELPIKDQGLMHFILGVTSFGIGCARADTPGIYTRVSSFVDWIEANVWPNN